MEDRYENLKDIETAINTKPIKEIVKHIDFTECLDKITLEVPWTKNNFENNHIIDSELLLADNFKDHFFRVKEIIEKKEDLLYYMCTWYKKMNDAYRFCGDDITNQRFYAHVCEEITKTFTAIYLEGIKKVGVVKLNKIIEKYLGYPLPNFCLKPEPWELLNTKQDPTTEIVEQKRLITYIDGKKQKVFDYILKKLENAQILETLTNSTYEYKWKAKVRDFAYFVSYIQGKNRNKVDYMNKMNKSSICIQWKPFLEAIEVRNQRGNLVKASECSDKIPTINCSNLRNSSSISKTNETLYQIKQILDDAEKLLN
jgi:hypothetical protein